MIRYGYACINTHLRGKGIFTSRSCRKSTLEASGLEYISDLAFSNATDLLEILKWNEENDIRLFRISSEIFPWWDRYELADLPNFQRIADKLLECGNYARVHQHRLTTHPGPFHILGSNKPTVVENAIIGLERHSEMFDLMGYLPSFNNAINIHVGASYGDKPGTLTNWLLGWDRLSDNAKARVVIENDDKKSLYTTEDLYKSLFSEINIPITFDYFHHSIHNEGMSEQEAFLIARSTWDFHNITQDTHYSDSRRIEYRFLIERICENNGISFDELPNWPSLSSYYDQFSKIKEQAHSDFVSTDVETYGFTDLDIEFEAKAKEQAVLRYLQGIREPILI